MRTQLSMPPLPRATDIDIDPAQFPPDQIRAGLRRMAEHLIRFQHLALYQPILISNDRAWAREVAEL